MMRRWTKAALLLVVAATIGCDQVTKHLAMVRLMTRPRQSFWGDTIRLEYAENAGVFLSLGARLPPWVRTVLFSGCTGILLIACVVAALRQRWRGLPLLGLALVFAGGVSNLFDRIAHGSTVDFLNVGVGSLRTGIVNLADMAITLGVTLLVLCRPWRAPEPEGGA